MSTSLSLFLPLLLSAGRAASLDADVVVDVVVVGAGYAGLDSARRLLAGGATVHVVEALDRVGGRAYDTLLENSNFTIENGVAFIGSRTEQPFAYELIVDQLGVGTFEFPIWGPGDCDNDDPFKCHADLLCRQRNGSVHAFSNLFPDIVTNKCVGDPKAVADLLIVTAELIAMAKEVNVEAPWDCKHAAAWDGQTFGSWLRSRMDPAGFEYMRITVEPDLCEDVDAVSVLHALFLSNAGGGIFDGLYAFNNVLRIQGGGGEPARRLAARLAGTAGYSSSFQERVHRIKQDNASVTVYTSSSVIQAQRVIVTGVPSVTAKIAFEPPLTANKRRALELMNGGTVVRMMAVYNQGPFWRRQNLSGSFGDLAPFTLAGLGYDMTPSDAKKDGYIPKTGVPGVIQVETAGRETAIYAAMSAEQRRHNFTSTLAALFGPEALNASDVLFFDFNTVPTLGGGKSAYPPGAWSEVGRFLSEPHGRIHWAGTEYSTLGFGYMEGALRSSAATSQQVLSELQF